MSKIRDNRLLSTAIIVVLAVFVLAGINYIIMQSDEIVYAEGWADDQPDQYQSYLRNAEMVQTTFGGSEPYDYLEKYPELKTIYEGVGFDIDYLRARGHVYALEDVINTGRNKAGASCLACKTADYVAMEEEHGSDLYAMDFYEMAEEAKTGVSCYDCHRNEPGVLQITRGHLEKGLEHLEEEHDMKNLVCAQCHIEYYLHPETKEVTVPWKYGTDVADIEATFIEWNFTDWTHPRTGGDLYKIQHPEFETYLGSVHDNFGATCVDCHMPQMENEEGGSYHHSHHWTSPLHTVESSCMDCHSGSEEDLIAEVEALQGEVVEKTAKVTRQLEELILRIEAEKDALPEDVREEVYQLQRSAQVRWDFVFVENSQGFHNHEKAMAYLREADEMIEKAHELMD